MGQISKEEYKELETNYLRKEAYNTLEGLIRVVVKDKSGFKIRLDIEDARIKDIIIDLSKLKIPNKFYVNEGDSIELIIQGSVDIKNPRAVLYHNKSVDDKEKPYFYENNSI